MKIVWKDYNLESTIPLEHALKYVKRGDNLCEYDTLTLVFKILLGKRLSDVVSLDEALKSIAPITTAPQNPERKTYLRVPMKEPEQVYYQFPYASNDARRLNVVEKSFPCMNEMPVNYSTPLDVVVEKTV